jgi:PIN domain nuclease of toxin-antitoxin system
MGRLLLDTHTVIWFLNGDDQLSDAAKDAIQNADNSCLISMASIWELQIKMNLGKLRFDDGIDGFINLAEDNGFQLLPIEVEHITETGSLAFIHRDPFDRLLIATAISESIPIVTADKNIHQYPVNYIW